MRVDDVTNPEKIVKTSESIERLIFNVRALGVIPFRGPYGPIISADDCIHDIRDILKCSRMKVYPPEIFRRIPRTYGIRSRLLALLGCSDDVRELLAPEKRDDRMEVTTWTSITAIKNNDELAYVVKYEGPVENKYRRAMRLATRAKVQTRRDLKVFLRLFFYCFGAECCIPDDASHHCLGFNLMDAMYISNPMHHSDFKESQAFVPAYNSITRRLLELKARLEAGEFDGTNTPAGESHDSE